MTQKETIDKYKENMESHIKILHAKYFRVFKGLPPIKYNRERYIEARNLFLEEVNKLMKPLIKMEMLKTEPIIITPGARPNIAIITHSR